MVSRTPGRAIAIIHAVAAEKGKSCNDFLIAADWNADPEVVIQGFHDWARSSGGHAQNSHLQKLRTGIL